MGTQAPMVHVATAALVRDGRVLLVHRHPDRANYPDCWDLPGGHVETGETPADAVVRECREELGVEISDPRPIRITIRDPQLRMHAFIVERWAGEPANLAPDEHDDLRWFTAGELTDLTLADAAALPDIVAVVGGSAGPRTRSDRAR